MKEIDINQVQYLDQPLLSNLQESEVKLEDKFGYESKFTINSLQVLEESNKISTCKYQWYNFLPKILIEQFTQTANIYFLIIGILQSISYISISLSKPVILVPLTFILIINGIKNLLEDYKRKVSDDEENQRKIEVFNVEKNTFEAKRWEDIRRGNIVKVYENDYFPADLLLISSNKSDSLEKNRSDGLCFIETKNLDGETNLKNRQSVKILCDYITSESRLQDIKGTIYCDPSNELIEEFKAKMIVDFIPKPIDIDKNNFLLRGCSLRETHSIYGIVFYVGHHTKIMKNSPNARFKTSKLQNHLNNQIIFVILVQLFLSVIAAIFYLIWISNIPFTFYRLQTRFLDFVFRIGSWILIFANLVPISLLVTMEMVKYFQGVFISWDTKMMRLNDITSGCKVQTSTLNEELGQVKFIFSDKTGTLTKNTMNFSKMSIGKYQYGGELIENGVYQDDFGKISNVTFSDKDNLFENHFNNKNHENYENIHLFLLCVCLCNSVFPRNYNISSGENLIYHGSSPDEIALVSGARLLNYIFLKRKIGNVIKLRIRNKFEYFTICHVLEYTSERKRMSVIVKSTENEYYLFTKGSDCVVSKLISQNKDLIKTTDNFIREFSTLGLRTLLFAYKKISNEEFEKISKEILESKGVDIETIYEKIEHKLYLLGSTGIEDQLQENLSEVLSSLIEIGIKIWVLTGDKLETAKSVALSCNLITKDFILFEIIDNPTYEITYHSLKNFQNQIRKKGNKKFGLIVSSEEILKIYLYPDLKEEFYRLSIQCDAVLCCRFSPKQKADMVNLIKEKSPTETILAIGDGANDVNMITTAHVGIGILGAEGRQAARASDYAISQFSFLKRLLLSHGSESYRKNSYIILYNFYKNIVFVVPQFWYGFFSFFSGQPLYNSFIYQLYNLLYTSIPIFIFGLLERKKSYDLLEKDGENYRNGMEEKYFNQRIFARWIAISVFESLLIYLFIFTTSNEIYNSEGQTMGLFTLGSVVYANVVLLVNLKLLIDSSIHTIISVLVVILSIMSYFLILMLFSYFEIYINTYDLLGDFSFIMYSPIFYLSSLLLIFVCLLVDFLMFTNWKKWRINFTKGDYNI